MRMMPYIHFRGNCRAAMEFYADLFGSDDLQIMPWATAPNVPEQWATSDRVMHSQLTTADGAVLMASDFPEGMEGDPQKAVSIMLAPKTVAAARDVFDALAKGGEIIDDFKATFFSPGFGMLKDQFGTHWIIGAEAEA